MNKAQSMLKTFSIPSQKKVILNSRISDEVEAETWSLNRHELVDIPEHFLL